LAAVAAALGLAGAFVFVVAVRHGWGQRLDEAMKAWWLPARADLQGPARALARLFAAPLAVGTVVGGAAVVVHRRRLDALVPLLAMALGGPALALLLKHELLSREVLVGGTFPPSNTLPSGHGAALATAAVVLVWLASPVRRRVVLGAAAMGLAAGGVVILLAALHRPSDVVASFLLIGAWCSLMLAVGGSGSAEVDGDEPRPLAGVSRAVVITGAAGLVLLAGGLALAARAVADERDADTTTTAVFAGGCALVAGVALLVVAIVAWAMGAAAVVARRDRRTPAHATAS
jgi:hypothetical protein